MDIITVINSFIIIGILIYLFKDKLKSAIISNQDNDKQKLYKFDDSFSDYEKNLLTKIHDKFYKYANNLIPLDIFYSILWQESGGEIYRGVSNDKIIGDGGNSIGFMQVNKYGALLEFNSRQNKNYSFEDLKDESKNIEVGQAYIYYALQLALNQSKYKPISWLVFKKYNGGLDEKENSVNAKAETYANNCYSKFLKVNKFINLNFS